MKIETTVALSEDLIAALDSQSEEDPRGAANLEIISSHAAELNEEPPMFSNTGSSRDTR